jgi:hypothetical protein
MWAEVPLLLALARWGGGMIPYRDKPAVSAAQSEANGHSGGSIPPASSKSAADQQRS